MSALQVGSCAEAYVYYRLLSWGIDVHFASGLSTVFDLWVTHNGMPVRIQVKGTSAFETDPRRKGDAYRFACCKGNKIKHRYTQDDFDILAVVALPEERCIFAPRPKTKTFRLPPDRFSREEEYNSWQEALLLREAK